MGYTNAGKSTLMNGITGAGVYVKDQLFATLDATTRRVEMDERRRFLLTDTVGFIRRLPHHLVESFKATLQEVREADLMVHVVDAGSEDPGAPDRLGEPACCAEIVPGGEAHADGLQQDGPGGRANCSSNRYRRLYPEAVFVAGKTAEGAAELRDAILGRLLGRRAHPAPCACPSPTCMPEPLPPHGFGAGAGLRRRPLPGHPAPDRRGTEPAAEPGRAPCWCRGLPADD